MKFTKYGSIEPFGADILEILLENEAQNNLPISFIQNEHSCNTTKWLLTTIKDETGKQGCCEYIEAPFRNTL